MFFMNQVDFKVLSDTTERIFFFAVFATVNWWFPFITKGNSLVILGPLEVIKFYMSITSTIALGLTLPFLMHFLWSFVKPGLKKEESR
ncbi:twin-arginine translocase subunit TatC [Viridibacillus sp. YIM B01967]|uniref:Twin-arginine translocase subunit TatC n=2 Tax=Viridibacillus soli TaxID=2798301 RepID=A0ABS1H582_9BACL|nr:twin-arginine translocase subunit TatC [Viridibacillus soli]